MDLRDCIRWALAAPPRTGREPPAGACAGTGVDQNNMLVCKSSTLMAVDTHCDVRRVNNSNAVFMMTADPPPCVAKMEGSRMLLLARTCSVRCKDGRGGAC